jgi:Flp pilus assembly protein TadG
MRTQNTGKNESGQTLVVAALALPMLIAFVGLAVDLGVLRYEQRKLQVVADTAARAGAAEILYNNVQYGAQAAAANNNFVNGSHGATLTVNNPPHTGPHSGNSSYVEVTATQGTHTFFANIFGIGSANVSARAVGALTSSGTCVYVLDPSASGAFSASGGVVFNATCGLFVNSNSSRALTTSGGACVTASQIGVVGGTQVNGCTHPTPVTGVHPVGDPLASVPEPTVGSCNKNNYSLSGGKTATIDAGVYCGGISLSGGSHLNLNPGTYILNGGGLQVSGGSILVGDGVTFFNTCVGSCPGGYQAISFSGGANNTLSAPTTGSLAGILFFQDRNIPSTQWGKTNTITGGSASTFAGALYFPNTPLSYSGGGSTNAPYTIVVARTLTISGGCTFNRDYSSLPDGSPVKQVELVE